MWTPPQRLKFVSSAGRVPDQTAIAGSRLFSPLAIGPMQVTNRVWVPAMVPWRASDEGEVTPEVLAWYQRFARGQPGTIVVEATGIRDVPSGPLLRIGHDRFLPGLRALVQTVREASQGRTRLLIQIIDFLSIRRRPEPQKYFERFLRVTPRHRELLQMPVADEADIRAHLAGLPRESLVAVLTARELEELDCGSRERVTDLELAHVRELPQVLPTLFAKAAGRARTAGFDGVELHYAHAYTMASFLSATNTREDGYGGPREHRVRLPLEVYEAVRAEVGPAFSVGCRFLAQEIIAQGSTLADTAWFASRFAQAGMDFLSTSRGGKFDDAKQPGIGWAAYPYTGPSGYECMPGYLSDQQGPFGRNVAATREIRAAVRATGRSTPLVCTGGIHNFEQAEALLADGTCDLVGIARQALADPDWPLKLRTGQGEQIRYCEYTNYCEGLDQKHKQVTCQLWDRQALDEPGLLRSRDGKRRLIAPAWSPGDGELD